MSPPSARSSSNRTPALASFSEAAFSKAGFALLLIALHLPLLRWPYFWDEVGQFVPAALDIYHSGELVPHSTIPNVHPPGVMLWIAGVWRWFGCSIFATRAAMLFIALLGCWWVYRLAFEFLCPDRKAAAMTVVLLALSPLFFSQAVMALLDMPAMAFTALALLMFFRERWFASTVACTLLVMVKETGALLPAVLGIVLLRERRWRDAVLFLLPALPLAGWLFLLHARTGQWFGNRAFAQYNLTYPLNPVRLGAALLRRLYYLFVGTGYFIGTIALWRARRSIVWSRAWRVVTIFAAVHLLAMCVMGGAVLERYLLPILPLVLAGFANVLARRPVAFAAMCATSIACMFINPLYPFPLENNLAWGDYVRVQKDASDYLSVHMPAGAAIAATFPFDNCLRRIDVGYTTKPFRIIDLPDSTPVAVAQARGADAFALFSSTWDPLGIERNSTWRAFLERFYDYHPDATPDQIDALLRMHPVARFERGGQWIELFRP